MMLERIKTALTAGDYAGARREKLDLLMIIIDDLLDADSEHCQDLNYVDYYGQWREVVEELRAMYIPEESL